MRFGCAYKIVEVAGGFGVRIYENGFCWMSELVDGKWQVCVFPTKEEAQKQADRYNDFSLED